jgi:5-methylcytosine-specific restriction endonuclease McrA
VPVSSKELLAIVEGQSYRCALSGVHLTPEMSSLDHKVAVSRGGSNDAENLQIIHPVVNYAKARMNNDEFIAMCHSIARAHPDTGCTSRHERMVAAKSSE